MNFYNEIDPFAAQWLRNLIAEGHIANGVVDERDIREIEAYELAEFTQCHFFAGIGVWPFALRQSGWSDDEPMWSGSCPCPPFSQAGKGQVCPACGSRRNICHPRRTGYFVCLACGCNRYADDRHLWPEFARLIRDGKPSKIVGEQVASADGRIWLGAVSADMQTMGYAVAGADICAAGFGGAHIRQRNFFVGLADDHGERCDSSRGIGREQPERHPQFSGPIGRMENTELSASPRQREHGSENLCDENSNRLAGTSITSGLADSSHGDRGSGERGTQTGIGADSEWRGRFAGGGIGGNSNAIMLGREFADWLYCRDGKWRPVRPGTFPLVNETTSRVGRLRAYGNALDAETATQFCGAVRDITEIRPVALAQEYDL